MPLIDTGLLLSLGRVSPIPNGAGWRLVLWKWLRFSAWPKGHMIIISDTLTQNNYVYGITVYFLLERWVVWFYMHFLSAAARFGGWGPCPVCLMWCWSIPSTFQVLIPPGVTSLRCFIFHWWGDFTQEYNAILWQILKFQEYLYKSIKSPD